MKNLVISTVILLTAVAIIAACNKKPMSTLVEDSTKGLNGSFEHSKEGMPVNWQMYTTRTVPSGDFDILLDTSDFKNGRQSLKFAVRECVATGGWHSPGIARQMDAKPSEKYKVTFWVKNRDSKFRVKIAGVSATKGESATIVETDEELSEWKRYEHTYTIPQKMNAIRFELNILHPGTFWIDDINIERI